MSRQDGSTAADTLPKDRKPAEQPKHSMNDKLAHRALGDNRPRSASTTLSEQARDRLYARMFPSDICAGSQGHGDADPVS